MRDSKAEYLPELLRGNTDSLLLFLVDVMEYTYGYQLIKEIKERSRGYFQFKEGTIYPALRKLENDGLISGEWQQVSSGMQRRYYRITDKGRDALKDKLAMWNNFITAMNLVIAPDISSTT
jgi:PadR family transcriptional regulator PadR